MTTTILPNFMMTLMKTRIPGFKDQLGSGMKELIKSNAITQAGDSEVCHEFFSFPGGDVHLYTGQTRDGVTLQVADVADGVIAKQDEFMVCSQCGKVYWKGSHWDKVKKTKQRQQTQSLM